MRVKTIRVENYRSIIDAGIVEIDPEMTNIVGMTGSGKTSFLKMVSGIDDKTKFTDSELPNGSSVKIEFQEGKKKPEDILQLTAIFEVEESDRSLMPEPYKKTNEITVKRYLDGHIMINLDKMDNSKIDLTVERGQIEVIITNMKANFQVGKGRDGNLPQHETSFLTSINNFLESDFTNLQELELSINTLRNNLNTITVDQQLRNELNSWLNEITNIRNQISLKIKDDPTNRLYEIIPKPLFKDSVFELQDEMSVDEFINNPSKSQTFYSIALVTGLTQSGVKNIRNAKPAERDSYLESKSRILSDTLNSFWKQETYKFRLNIDNGKLSFVVSDKTTQKETSVLERSEGFKWWVAFFLEISTFLATQSGRKIILLDNPATELHDDGKSDVLQFIRNASKSGRLQIIYSTHERALIDPWRTDRIRVVELTKNGTKISNVRNQSRHDLLNTIRRSIGSPAKYSLFGAPRTLAFEGVSDTYLISAVNEYFEQEGLALLNKDSYSFNAINGIDKAPNFCKLHKELGIDFAVVVDSGSETETMKRNLERIDDFEKHFVEIKDIIGKDGDSEDLFDPELYYLAFQIAYKPILSTLPAFTDIEDNSTKKTITKYDNWFSSKGKEFDKTLVAQQMFKIMMSSDLRKSKKTNFDKTQANFMKLFELINKKFM